MEIRIFIIFVLLLWFTSSLVNNILSIWISLEDLHERKLRKDCKISKNS